MQELLAYDPARLRALALRTAAAIQWLDAPSSTEPLAQDAVTYQTPDGVDAVWSDMTDAAFTTDQAPAPYDIDPQAFP